MSDLTPEDVAAYTRGMASLGALTPTEFEAGIRLVRPREIPRRAYLLRAGMTATECGVLVSGLLREHFVTSKGIERTKHFIGPSEPFGSLPDLLTGQPSRAFTIAEEPCRILVASWAGFQELAATLPAWAIVVRRSAEQILIRKAEREYEFLCLDAEQRYAAFRARFRGLETRVSARHVASYLGITPEHLSRLRRRRVTSRRAEVATALRS